MSDIIYVLYELSYVTLEEEVGEEEGGSCHSSEWLIASNFMIWQEAES